MKKLVTILMAFAFLGMTFSAGAQETETIKLSLPNLLIHANSIDPISYYELGGDINVLSKKDLTDRLVLVDVNQPLLKEAKLLDIGMWTSFGVGLAGTIIAYMDSSTNLFADKEWVGTAAVWSSITGFCLSALCSTFENGKFIKAVDNYNLYILGIPVAGKN